MKNDDNYDEEKWGLQLLQRTRKMLRQITSNNYGWQTRNLSSAIAGWMEVDVGRFDLGDVYAALRRRPSGLALDSSTSAGPRTGKFTVAQRLQHFSNIHIQGDHSTCSKPPVDFRTKVPLWPSLSWAGPAKTELSF